MNFEKSILPDNGPILPEHLLDACEQLAEILANNEWLDPGTREVSISRSFTEALGYSSETEIGGEPVRQIKMRTTVSFQGEKEVIAEEDGDELLEELYAISATLSEVVHYSKLPTHVLERFARSLVVIERADYEDDEEDDEDEDEFEDEVAEATPGSPEFNPSTLQGFVFEHEYEIRYVINNDGDLDNHFVIVRYKADKAVIEESIYGWNDGDERKVRQATATKDMEGLEWKSVQRTEFQEADVVEFLSNFEQIIQTVLDSEEFFAMRDKNYEDDNEHNRRALGIVALVAANFDDFKL